MAVCNNGIWDEFSSACKLNMFRAEESEGSACLARRLKPAHVGNLGTYGPAQVAYLGCVLYWLDGRTRDLAHGLVGGQC